MVTETAWGYGTAFPSIGDCSITRCRTAGYRFPSRHIAWALTVAAGKGLMELERE